MWCDTVKGTVIWSQETEVEVLTPTLAAVANTYRMLILLDTALDSWLHL